MYNQRYYNSENRCFLPLIAGTALGYGIANTNNINNNNQCCCCNKPIYYYPTPYPIYYTNYYY